MKRVATVATLAFLLSACTHTHSTTPAGSASARATPTGLYVALGAGDSRGEGTDNPLRNAWTQQFFRTLPLGFDFVNLASNGATTADAIATQLPEALELHPTLVTLSLSVNDLLESIPPQQYRAELATLVQGLRSAGTTVLLASAPQVQSLPAYLACVDPAHHRGECSSAVAKPVPSVNAVTAEVAAYNAAISSVAASERAALVNLDAAGASIEAPGVTSPFGADGFDPNVSGADAIAALFEAAWRHLPASDRPG